MFFKDLLVALHFQDKINFWQKAMAKSSLWKDNFNSMIKYLFFFTLSLNQIWSLLLLQLGNSRNSSILKKTAKNQYFARLSLFLNNNTICLGRQTIFKVLPSIFLQKIDLRPLLRTWNLSNKCCGRFLNRMCFITEIGNLWNTEVYKFG